MHRSLSRSDSTQVMPGHKLSPDIQKLEREKRIKKMEEMKANASPLPKKWLISKERNDQPIDPQSVSEGRSGEREVEVSTTIEAPQLGEAVPGALPLAIVPTKDVGKA